MTCCAVKGCHNTSHSQKKQSKIPFHGFPSDPTEASRWIEKLRLNRKENFWKPTKYTKICSLHFDEKDKYITKGGLCKLREGAIPTKGLHIFCTEESQKSNDVCNETSSHDPKLMQALGEPKLDKTQLGPHSSCAEETQLSHDHGLHSPRELGTPVPVSILVSREDTESIFDSPRKSALRSKLRKKTALLHKVKQKLRALQQEVRRLKKKNASLQNIFKELEKKIY